MLKDLILCRVHDLTLELQDTKGTEHLGEVVLSATLWPRTQQDKEQVNFFKSLKIFKAVMCFILIFKYPPDKVVDAHLPNKEFILMMIELTEYELILLESFIFILAHLCQILKLRLITSTCFPQTVHLRWI